MSRQELSIASGLESALQRATCKTGSFFDCRPHSFAESSRLRWKGRASIEFQPMFDQMRGAGATIRYMLDFLFDELERSDTLLTNEIAIHSFEENLALCLLLGLPHHYTERLQWQKTPAAPGQCTQGRSVHAR